MDNPDEKQKIIDDEHLKLLSLFYYISGGLTLGFAVFMGGYFFFIFYIINSVGFQQGVNQGINSEMPETIMSIMMVAMGVVFVLGIIFGIVQIVSGRLLNLRKLRLFSFIIGIINLLSLPFGTILGIMTLIVLGRSSVVQQYSDQN